VEIVHSREGRTSLIALFLAMHAATYCLAHKLFLADTVIYATAGKFETTLWTQDIDLKPLDKVRFYSKS
jgi:predicted nucleic acid-binding protein